MKLSRDLSNLVVFTNSVASQECLNEGKTLTLWHLHKHKLIGTLQSSSWRHFLMPYPCFSSGTPADVLSFSETRAQSLVNHRAEQFLAFNQRQLSRIYPSAYRIDSSNFNPQFYWNVGCQLGKTTVTLAWRQGGCLFMKTRGVLPLTTYLSLHINWHCIPHACTHKNKFYLWPADHTLHVHSECKH